MKIALSTGAALLLTTTTASAVGLDRSNQDIGAIFEDGNYVELSFGSVRPTVGGTDLPNPLSAPQFAYDDVAEDFSQIGLSLTYQLNDRVTLAIIADQPYGADVVYPVSGAFDFLGGTRAELDSRTISALARYKLDDNFSVHGGIRMETIGAGITLAGQAYGPLNGYNVELDDSTEFGFTIGTAYERTDIALRVALTYFSSIEHEFDSTETVGGTAVAAPSVTTVETPEAWNLDFQTGVAADTLVFGQIRHAKYSQVIVSPAFFAGATGGASLTDIDDGTSVTVGVARRFSDQFAASASYSWEAADDDDLVSPLAPTNGNRAISIGGQYTMGDFVFSGGVRYTLLGDASPETGTPDVARADFSDNDAISVGLSVGYNV